LENDNQRKVKDLVPGLPVSAGSLFRWPPDNLSHIGGTPSYYVVYSLPFVSWQTQEQPILEAFMPYHVHTSSDLGFDLWYCHGSNMELRKYVTNINK